MRFSCWSHGMGEYLDLTNYEDLSCCSWPYSYALCALISVSRRCLRMLAVNCVAWWYSSLLRTVYHQTTRGFKQNSLNMLWYLGCVSSEGTSVLWGRNNRPHADNTTFSKDPFIHGSSLSSLLNSGVCWRPGAVCGWYLMLKFIY